MREYNERIDFTNELDQVVHSIISDKSEGNERYKKIRQLRCELKKQYNSKKMIISFNSI